MTSAAALLVVEDDPLDQILLKKAFSRVDVPFDYEFCDSAEAALDRLENGENPHVIMTDLRMPGMGGLEFLSRLKKQGCLGHIPTLVFSTSNHDDDVRAAYQRRASAYVVKPDSISGYERFADRLVKFWFEETRYPQS
ncbi:response regulator [Ponticaulis koreensis]|uniref:response regulator n=1 Tax=Ponticaulis koreensis TaxID=1123045 RepID=UPI0003B5E98E|nr:response regulator [Ponticaulis koreensis]